MIFHIDMSNHYDQKKYTVLAMVSVDLKQKRDYNIKKGIILTESLRSKLLKKYSVEQLHAGLISLLLEPFIPIKKVIVCPDVRNTEKVFGIISSIHPQLVLGCFRSLNELREEIGKHKYKSEADAFARRINRSYSKRKNIHRNNLFLSGNVEIISSEKSELCKRLEEKLRRFIESNR